MLQNNRTTVVFTKHSDHLSNGNAAGMPNQTGHHHCFLLLEGMEKKVVKSFMQGLIN
jgi:hypothetical protein